MIGERLAAQLLSGAPATDPVVVAGRLLAAQGQDPRAARLAVRARTTGLSAADVDRALTEDRSLLITWQPRQSELDERPDGLVGLAGRPDAPVRPPPRLLGPFDPILLRLDFPRADPRLASGSRHERDLLRLRARPRLRSGDVKPASRQDRADALRADQPCRHELEADAADVVRFLADV